MAADQPATSGAGLAELHRRALDATRRTVAGIDDGQWDDPTPCDDWNVRELLNHVVAGNHWAAELGAGRTIAEVGTRLDGDQVGGDPIGSYDVSAAAAAAVFEADGALDAPCAVSYGPVPGAVYAGHRFIDVLIHGWDLAVATGQDPTLDPALVDACVEVVRPQFAELRSSGAFGPDAHDDPAADPQTRLLGMLGRSL